MRGRIPSMLFLVLLGWWAVNRVRVKQRLFVRDPRSSTIVVGGVVELAEEATGVAAVAGSSLLPDLEQDGVTIAVDQHLLDLLNVATGLAFLPQALARTAEVDGSSRPHRFLKRVAIHPTQHKYTPRCCILSNGRQQVDVAGEIRQLCGFHGVYLDMLGR